MVVHLVDHIQSLLRISPENHVRPTPRQGEVVLLLVDHQQIAVAVGVAETSHNDKHPSSS